MAICKYLFTCGRLQYSYQQSLIVALYASAQSAATHT